MLVELMVAEEGSGDEDRAGGEPRQAVEAGECARRAPAWGGGERVGWSGDGHAAKCGRGRFCCGRERAGSSMSVPKEDAEDVERRAKKPKVNAARRRGAGQMVEVRYRGGPAMCRSWAAGLHCAKR